MLFWYPNGVMTAKVKLRAYWFSESYIAHALLIEFINRVVHLDAGSITL